MINAENMKRILNFPWIRYHPQHLAGCLQYTKQVTITFNNIGTRVAALFKSCSIQSELWISVAVTEIEKTHKISWCLVQITFGNGGNISNDNGRKFGTVRMNQKSVEVLSKNHQLFHGKDQWFLLQPECAATVECTLSLGVVRKFRRKTSGSYVNRNVPPLWNTFYH